MPGRPRFYLTSDEINSSSPALQQGDILARVPFPAVTLKSAAIATDKSTRTVDFTAEDVDSASSFLVSRFALYPALVITQSCDLERGDRPIQVCAVRPFKEAYPDQEIGSPGFIKRIAEFANAGKKPTALPLPPLSSWEVMSSYSIADISFIVTLSAANRDALIEMRKARLSSEALSLLQERISTCFGRFAASEGIF